MDGIPSSETWVEIGKTTDLDATGRHLAKVDGRQIAVFKVNGEFLACDNRCPHEGYPLIEGSMSESCVLTCNWHNWKFDLKTGETMVGGDRLRRYPVRIDGDRVLADVSPPTADEIVAFAVEDLLDCFDDHDYGRMAREVARIISAGGDPMRGVRAAVLETHDRFEFGMTHAIAAGADWLSLAESHADDETARLAALTETIALLAWDSRRQPTHPYPSDEKSFDKKGLVDAIEAENEAEAIAYVRGALAEGLVFDDLHEALATAALAHYQDFGHSLIYVEKAKEFIERAGNECLEPVVLQLVRGLVFASREDLIPAFKAYAPALADWSDGEGIPDDDALRTRGTAHVLAAIRDAKNDVDALYDALMHAGAWQLLHMDLSYSQTQSGPVQDNVGWLDFTHTITFANAVRRTCMRFPHLWPQGLLQIGCFLGRNAKYVDAAQDVSEWSVPNPAAFATQAVEGALDHGEAEYIVAAHIVKLSTAVSEEISANPNAIWTGTLAAALNRFLNSPLKRKHTLRTAYQALQMVARE